MKRRLPHTIFALAGALTFSLSAPPADAAEGKISKVKYYHLEPGKRVETEDRMIQFEQRHYLHGAVTTEEFKEKFGNYYTVSWKKKEGSNVTVRFEYRQRGTGPEVHSQEVVVDKVKRWGKNATHFRVTGDPYDVNGPVTAWKASLIVDGQVVDENKSFLWE